MSKKGHRLILPTADDPIVVVHGDSLPILKRMADGSIDSIITDPPYAEKTHAGARSACPGVGLTTKKLIKFDSIDDDAFLSLCEQAVRISRRWVVMTCDWRHAAAAERSDLPVVRLGVWIKPDAAPQFTGDRPGTGWEAVIMLHRRGRKRWNGGGHHAVWTCEVQRGNQHPTQKPLRLVRKWIRLFTDPGETVMDPFAGSGTTGVGAIQEGRLALLIERDADHAAVCRERALSARLGYDQKHCHNGGLVGFGLSIKKNRRKVP